LTLTFAKQADAASPPSYLLIFFKTNGQKDTVASYRTSIPIAAPVVTAAYHLPGVSRLPDVRE
jgi:hypothetical protein